MAFPLRGAPQALVMLVAERLRAAPKEEVLLGTSLCSSEIRGDRGKGPTPCTLHLGFRNRQDPCTRKRGQSFLRRGRGRESPTQPFVETGHQSRDTNTAKCHHDQQVLC